MTGIPFSLRQLVSELAGALGETEAAVLGVPVAVDMRWRHEERGFFLSGVPGDLLQSVSAAFGATLQCRATLVAEWWSAPGMRGIGTGPVVVDDTGDGAPLILAHRREGEPTTRLEQARMLRAQFAITARRLESSLPMPLDASALLAAIDDDPAAGTRVIGDMADSRELVGRYLLDAGDELDDERVDQLGDGYVRAAALWAGLPGHPEPDLVAQVLELERSCLQWMLGAALPPTRYAF